MAKGFSWACPVSDFPYLLWFRRLLSLFFMHRRMPPGEGGAHPVLLGQEGYGLSAVMTCLLPSVGFRFNGNEGIGHPSRNWLRLICIWLWEFVRGGL